MRIFSRQLGYQIEGFRVGFWRKDGDEKLESINLTSETNALIDKMLPFAITDLGEEVCLHDLFKECLSMTRSEILAQLDLEKQIFAELDAQFEPDNISTQTTHGKRYIQAILFQVKFFVEEKQLPILKPFRYTDEHGKIIDSFSQSKDPETGITVNIKFGWDDN